MKITFIDNFDSFTYNLVHLIGSLGVEVKVYRNNAVTSEAVMTEKPDCILLSPGPCTPNEAGICLDLIKKAHKTIPMLGVCLGHQAMGQAFGGEVVRAPTPIHGKVATLSHKNKGLFHGINGDFKATRYHSLVVERKSLPKELEVTAEVDNLIMGMQHIMLPLYGVQFHPESIASEHGKLMMQNFLTAATKWNSQK